MGPVQSHAPAALQDQVHVCHHQYDQGGDSQNPATGHEDGEGHDENPCGGGAGGRALCNSGDSCFKECCYMGGEFVLGCPGWERRVV